MMLPVIVAVLDLHKIVRSQSELSRAKTVLSEGKVAVATLREEKLFVADRIRSGDVGVLRKSSVCRHMVTASVLPHNHIIHRIH